MNPGAPEAFAGGPDPLLRRILDGEPPPFALVHRPRTTGPDRLELMVGTLSRPGSLAGLPLPQGPGTSRHDVLAVLPYRLLAERGYTCPDDGTPLLALTIEEQRLLSR
ncbi:phenazine biosynthesis protein phzE, partial [Streptomyces sp. PalvLS-984]